MSESRKKKAAMNIAVSLLNQVATVICGLIVPRLIIGYYGSSINGLVSSITQFLSYIVLLEAGVGGVVKAALYRPLAKKDAIELSKVVAATERFFRNIAKIFLCYICLLAIIYPLIVTDYSWVFTATLIIIISISTFAQYFFGITNQLIIQSDQRMYISTFVQTGTMILNAVAVYVCVSLKFEIHYLKLVTSFVYVIRPLYYSYYVGKKYNINKKITVDHDTLKQKWDGLGQHIAYVVHTNTDVSVLTIFTDVMMVSVYTVYHNVINGIVSLVSSFQNGISASIGNLIANEENNKLKKVFDVIEVINYMLICVFFSTTAIVITPFIKIYTDGVHDVEYLRPTFALLLVIAEAIYCMRSPYSTIIYAAGHYKQTTKGAFIEAIVNILISVILVTQMGLIGVAIGTLVAMLIRTTEYILYLRKNILYRSAKYVIKELFVCSIIILLIYFFKGFVDNNSIHNYFTWALYSLQVLIICSFITLFVNFIFYRPVFKEALVSCFPRIASKIRSRNNNRKMSV